MLFFLASCILLRGASAHIALFHPSMWGFNVTAETPIPLGSGYSTGNNRVMNPLYKLPFKSWWFHGHLDYPPHPNDVMTLPAGGNRTVELACHKGATSYAGTGGESPPGDKGFASGENPCPGSPITQFHTNGINDLGGCALGIAYKSNVSLVNPQDFAIFSVNHTCVWSRFTDFKIPANMPPCPNGKCICAFFWIHREDSGGEEMYMNGFQCNITNANSHVPIPPARPARRCGAGPNVLASQTSNCTVGAKAPFYWLQAEGNNMFEDYYSPPLYHDLYGFRDGAQDDLWDTVSNRSPNLNPIPAAPLDTSFRDFHSRVGKAHRASRTSNVLRRLTPSPAVSLVRSSTKRRHAKRRFHPRHFVHF